MLTLYRPGPENKRHVYNDQNRLARRHSRDARNDGQCRGGIGDKAIQSCTPSEGPYGEAERAG